MTYNLIQNKGYLAAFNALEDGDEAALNTLALALYHKPQEETPLQKQERNCLLFHMTITLIASNRLNDSMEISKRMDPDWQTPSLTRTLILPKKEYHLAIIALGCLSSDPEEIYINYCDSLKRDDLKIFLTMLAEHFEKIKMRRGCFILAIG